MGNLVPPVPFSAAIGDPAKGGLVPPVWADWFKQIFDRVGGHILKGSELASGYQTLPSGLVVQWGETASIASGTNETIQFPIAFPTACLQVLVGTRGISAASTSETGHYGSGGYLKTEFDLYNRTSAAYAFNWLAVGF